MPQPLKLHLIDLQGSIISHKLWQNPELLSQIQVCAIGEDYSQNETIDRCLRTILVQIGVQISEMAKALSLDEVTS